MKSIVALLILGLAATHLRAQALVVTTSPVLQTIADEISGGLFRVESLLPPGQSSSMFEPGDEQLQLLNEAQLLIINGAGYEPWLEDLERQSNFDGAAVVVTDGVALYDLDGFLHDADAEIDLTDPATFAISIEFDPYAWLDPRNAVFYAQNIGNALSDLVDGSSRAAIEERTAAVISEIRDLNGYAETQFATILPRDRVFVTSLDKLQYLAAAYGFRVIRIPGLASGQELRPALEARLIDTILSYQPLAVFFEPNANSRELRRLEAATGAKMVTNLYLTEPGPRSANANTYVGMMRANVKTIVEALHDPNDPNAPPAASSGN